jgi:hypothetical protein
MSQPANAEGDPVVIFAHRLDDIVCRFRFSVAGEAPSSLALRAPASGGCGIDGASPATARSTISSMNGCRPARPPPQRAVTSLSVRNCDFSIRERHDEIRHAHRATRW